MGADLLADGRLRFVAGDRADALKSLDEGGFVIVPLGLATRDDLAVGSELDLGDRRRAGPAAAGRGHRRADAARDRRRDDPRRLEGRDGVARRHRRRRARGPLRARPRSRRPAGGRRAGHGVGALEPTPLSRVATAVDVALGRVFGLFDALAIIAVIVAALGIVNTLSMNVLERVRELGVLRAAGMTRTQVRRTVVVEAGILGLSGSFLGIVTGLVAGALMIALAGGTLGIGLDLPWGSIGLAAVLGIGLSMVAAWYPARLASRLAIVRAVQHE